MIPSSRSINQRRLDYVYLFVVCLTTVLLLIVYQHSNSLTSSDECVYLTIAEEIAEGKAYSWGFPDGRPFIPSVIATFQALGLNIINTRTLIPIIFMPMALISTFILGKTLIGRKEGYIATLFLFTFPFFWDIGNTVLVEIPLSVFATLFLLFFYIGIDKDKKYLYLASVFISIALLTKLSAVLFLLPALAYLIIKKRLNVCLSKHFICSVFIIPIVVFGVFALFYFKMSAEFDLSKIVESYAIQFNLYEILRLCIAPVLVFAIFGIHKKTVYLWLPVLSFFLFWAIQGRVFDIRQFACLFPIVGVLVAVGFYWLLDRFHKKIIYTLMSCLLVVSFINVLYINDYHQDTLYGITSLLESVEELDGKVATDFDAVTNYLWAVTDHDVMSAFTYSGTYPDRRPTYEVITDEWLTNNEVSYLILSLYGEKHRAQWDSVIHPKFLMIEIPFIEVGEYGQLPPADCRFESGFYYRCERDYQRVATIKKGEQTVFIIYQVKRH